MSDYVKVPTTQEVWAAVMAKHRDQLVVFESFSNPDGHAFGGGGAHGEMMTVYGFVSSETPLIGARTTWDIEKDALGQPQRRNETHAYWLCA
jgi:hypothetical protein